MEKHTAMPAIQVKLGQNKKRWSVTSNGHVLARPNSKQEAIDIGRALAKKSGEELVIFGKYGQIFHGGSSMSEAKENRIRTAIREIYHLPKPDPEMVDHVVQQITMKHPNVFSSSISHRLKRHSLKNGARRKK